MIPRTARWLALFFAAAFVVVALVVPGCGGGSSTNGDTGDGSVDGDDATPDVNILGADGAPLKGCAGYPGQDPSKLSGANCCSYGPSHCAPTSAVPAGVRNGFNGCGPDGSANGSLCVPDTIIQAGSEYVPTTCTTKLLTWTLQGVCLSECITLVSGNSQVSLLKKETCGQGELCVPCIDPLTMMPTGSCNIDNIICGDGGTLQTDAAGGPMCPYTGPPLIDPTQFPACSPACNGAHCVPASLVPAADQSRLASCTSNGTPGFCAPDSFISSDGQGLPKTCTSVAGSEGRCLSTCLPEITAQANLLPQDVCAADEKCAPCYDPVAADPTMPTGACSLACDKPAKPPTMINCPYTGPPIIDPSVFPACAPACNGAHCLPAAEVPASVQSQLAPCNNGTGFCTPDEIISTADKLIPTSCDPFPGSGAPGRCLSDCLPAVQKEVASGTLVQSSCSTGQYCVPCNDPFTGASTGACTLGCDTPPTTPFTFPVACDDGSGQMTATCVPAALVPSSQASSLDQTCNGNSAQCPSSPANYLCVPDSYLPAPYNHPPITGCPATFLNLCGVCVSQCVNNSTLGILGQSNCAANDKCVPCSLASSTPGCSTFCP